MSTTEAQRHHLIERARDIMGPEAAMTLAELLPPSGWSDVARRSDLDDLERRMDLRFEAMDAKVEGRLSAMDAKFQGRLDAIDARFDAIDARFDAVDVKFDALDDRLDGLRHELLAAIATSTATVIRTLVFAMIGTMIAVGTLAIGLAQLWGPG